MDNVFRSTCKLKRVGSYRFAPSKSLQEARGKLGVTFYNLRLVECRQNAVELAKLLQTLGDIDKKQLHAEEENNRNQRLLLSKLQNKQISTKVPRSGFRYLLQCSTTVDAKCESENHIIPLPETSDGNLSGDIVLKQTNSQHSLQYENSFISDESEDEVSDEDKPLIKGTLETCKSGGNLLKVSANLIKQIERELELNRSEIRKEISKNGKVVKSSQDKLFHISAPALPSRSLIPRKSVIKLETKTAVVKGSDNPWHHTRMHSSSVENIRSKIQIKPSACKRGLTGNAESKHQSHRSMTLLKTYATSNSIVTRMDSQSSRPQRKIASATTVRVNKEDEFQSSYHTHRRRTLSADSKSMSLLHKPAKYIQSNTPASRCSSVDIIKQQVVSV